MLSASGRRFGVDPQLVSTHGYRVPEYVNIISIHGYTEGVSLLLAAYPLNVAVA